MVIFYIIVIQLSRIIVGELSYIRIVGFRAGSVFSNDMIFIIFLTMIRNLKLSLIRMIICMNPSVANAEIL